MCTVIGQFSRPNSTYTWSPIKIWSCCFSAKMSWDLLSSVLYNDGKNMCKLSHFFNIFMTHIYNIVTCDTYKLIKMVNFKLSNEMWRWINQNDRSVEQRVLVDQKMEHSPSVREVMGLDSCCGPWIFLSPTLIACWLIYLHNVVTCFTFDIVSPLRQNDVK